MRRPAIAFDHACRTLCAVTLPNRAEPEANHGCTSVCIGFFFHRLPNVGPQPTRGLPCFLAMRAGSARYQRRILPSVPRLQSNGTRPNGTGTCASIYPHEEQIREPSVVTIFPSDRGPLHNK